MRKFLFVFPILSCLLLPACFVSVESPFGMYDSPMPLEQIISGKDNDKILIIPINGTIMDKPAESMLGGSRGDSLVAKVREMLRFAEADQTIKGIILKINSPGGTVTASDILYTEIMKLKQKKNIPVCSLFMETAASGAYYIAMASDCILSHPTTITGSIGVIFQGINMKNTLDKLGMKEQAFTSGDNKNIGSPFREMREDQKKIMQGIIDNLYSRFFQIVKKNRSKIPEDKLKSLADGRIFTADQAKETGLIDQIGYFEDSIKLLMAQANYKKSPGNDSPRIFTYATAKRPVRNVYQIRNEWEDSTNILDRLGNRLGSSQFLYLWNGYSE